MASGSRGVLLLLRIPTPTPTTKRTSHPLPLLPPPNNSSHPHHSTPPHPHPTNQTPTHTAPTLTPPPPLPPTPHYSTPRPGRTLTLMGGRRVVVSMQMGMEMGLVAVGRNINPPLPQEYSPRHIQTSPRNTARLSPNSKPTPPLLHLRNFLPDTGVLRPQRALAEPQPEPEPERAWAWAWG